MAIVRGGARLAASVLAAVLAAMLAPAHALGPAARPVSDAGPPAGAGSGGEAARCSTYSIAHRGEHKFHDENTVPAITAVRRAEVDLRVTSDGRLILMHDKRVNRTTNGTGYVHQLTWEYISSLHTEPYGARVPTLARALDAVESSGTRLVVEIKNYSTFWSEENLQQVAQMVRNHQLESRIHFGGHGALQALAAGTPDMQTYWRPNPGDPITAESIEQKSADAVIVLPRRLTEQMVLRVNSGGYLIWARRGIRPPDVTRAEEWERLDRIGVQGIYTDAPIAFDRWCSR